MIRNLKRMNTVVAAPPKPSSRKNSLSNLWADVLKKNRGTNEINMTKLSPTNK
jgi:hypothetical protein